MEYNYELYHHGIKGMRCGVRRYQNKDGSLTPAGKKRILMADYDNAGASKSLQKRHGRNQLSESQLRKKVAAATERLETGNNNLKYSNKQRAKDYETAIRGLSVLRDRQAMQGIDDSRHTEYNNQRLARLKTKRMTEKRRAKIEKLTTDNELMELRMTEANDKYSQFSDLTNRLVNKMASDGAVVYTTRRRTHAYSESIKDRYYSISGTDYKVRANTKRRANSKKYTDPDRKKEHETRLTQTTVYYY